MHHIKIAPHNIPVDDGNNHREVWEIAPAVIATEPSDKSRIAVGSRLRALHLLFAKFEELSEVGGQFLRGYQQELLYFRRPPLDKSSDRVGRIIKANKTDRMVAYLEEGCRLTHCSLQNTEKLFSCQQGLQVHIEKVKELVDELEGSSENALDILREATERPEPQSNTSINDALVKLTISTNEEEALEDFLLGDLEHDYLEGIMCLFLTTRMMLNMLKLEYMMQEKVVRSLNLNSSSEELESYCMLWELRPYIDDNIIRQLRALVK